MDMTYPPVVSREKRLVARKGLLAKEKEFTTAATSSVQVASDHFCVRHISKGLVDRPAVTDLVNELTRPVAMTKKGEP
jgi:hypothetical protein